MIKNCSSMKGKDRTESTEGCNWDEVEKWKHHRIRIEIPTGVSGAGGRGRTEGGGVVGVLVTGDTRAVAPLDTKSPSDCWHGWHGTQSHWTDTRTNGEQKLNFNVRHSQNFVPDVFRTRDLHSETSQVIRLSETGLGFCRAGSGVTENLERGSPPPSPETFLSRTHLSRWDTTALPDRPQSVCGPEVWSLQGNAFLSRLWMIT